MTERFDPELTAERIRAAMEGTPGFARRLRGAERRGAPIELPADLPSADEHAPGGTLIPLLAKAFDAVAGPGAGTFVSDSTRLLELLGHLAEGTIEDAAAREEAMAENHHVFVHDERMAAQYSARCRQRAAALRAIPAEEVQAVLASLDQIETVYPREVARVRFRHDPKVRAERLAAAATLRTGDPARPALTPERVRRVLEVLRQLVPVPQKMQAMFGTRYALEGKPALELLGAAMVKKVAKLGEDPEAYARDLFWTQLIAYLIDRGKSVDEQIAETIGTTDPSAWLTPHAAPARAKRLSAAIAAMMRIPFEAMRRIAPSEEAAVRDIFPELLPVLETARGR